MDFFVLFKQNKLNNLNKQFHSFFSFFGIQDITWHIFEYYLHLKCNWGCIFLSFFEYTWIKSVILVLEFAHHLLILFVYFQYWALYAVTLVSEIYILILFVYRFFTAILKKSRFVRIFLFLKFLFEFYAQNISLIKQFLDSYLHSGQGAPSKDWPSFAC